MLGITQTVFHILELISMHYGHWNDFFITLCNFCRN